MAKLEHVVGLVLPALGAEEKITLLAGACAGRGAAGLRTTAGGCGSGKAVVRTALEDIALWLEPRAEFLTAVIKKSCDAADVLLAAEPAGVVTVRRDDAVFTTFCPVFTQAGLATLDTALEACGNGLWGFVLGKLSEPYQMPELRELQTCSCLMVFGQTAFRECAERHGVSVTVRTPYEHDRATIRVYWQDDEIDFELWFWYENGHINEMSYRAFRATAAFGKSSAAMLGTRARQMLLGQHPALFGKTAVKPF